MLKPGFSANTRCRGIDLLILAAGALLLFYFIAAPTIDFDEGYFFQPGLHALKSGKPGFPWTDALYGAPHLYIPLNSLDPLVNWPLAYLPPPWWLLSGRLLSALAVCLGVIVLYAGRRESGRDYLQTGVLLFLATCLPLILIGRQIRPDGLAFFGFCAALLLASKPQRRWTFAAGLLIGLVALAHAIHGLLAGAVILGMVLLSPPSSIAGAVKRALVYVVGASIPIVVFYGVYCAIEGPASVWRDANLLMALTPHYVSSLAPGDNFMAWANYVRSQANTWPLLGFALLALLTPIEAAAPGLATRFLKAAIVGLLIFWIFFYPKKAYTIVVLLLPMAIVLYYSARNAWPRLFGLAFVLCLAANTALLVRYHWRLLEQPGGMAEVAPILGELKQQGAIRPGAAVMGKLWLVFALPRDVTLWDVGVFPLMLGKNSSASAGFDEAIRRSDAVVLERDGDGWMDAGQAELARHLAAAGWREVPVQTRRYFQPAEISIFLPR